MVKESLDDLYPKALEGFLIILSQDSDIIYVSDNVAKYLGIAQVKSYFCVVSSIKTVCVAYEA